MDTSKLKRWSRSNRPKAQGKRKEIGKNATIFHINKMNVLDYGQTFVRKTLIVSPLIRVLIFSTLRANTATQTSNKKNRRKSDENKERQSKEKEKKNEMKREKIMHNIERIQTKHVPEIFSAITLDNGHQFTSKGS